MQVDADTLLKVLQFAFTLGATFFAWSQAKNKAGAEALKDLETKLSASHTDAEGKVNAARSEIAALSARVSKFEGEMQHMPDKDTVHKIELGMKDMQTQIAAQAEVLKGYADALKQNTVTMQRLEEFLLQGRQTAVQPVRRR